MQKVLIHQNLLKRVDLASLKYDAVKLDIDKVDKLDVDKLVSVSVDLSKRSDVLKNDVLKKDVCNAKIKSIEDKIPDVTNLATNATLNAKINEVKNEIPSITNLATKTALTAVENKRPNVSNSVEKSDYNTNTNQIETKITTNHDHDKYIATQEFNKSTSENFCTRLAQANLGSKNHIGNYVKKTDFVDKLKTVNKKVTSNKTKHVLVENEFKKKEVLTKGLTKTW